MGHGNHWEAIEGTLEKTIARMIPLVVDKGEIEGNSEFEVRRDGQAVRREQSYGILHGEGSLRYMVILGTDSTQGKPHNLVYSAFPVCFEGVRHRLTIEEVQPWGNGVEGVIQVLTPSGISVQFFDPFFYRTEKLYHVGETRDFFVAALAMSLHPPKTNEIEVTEGGLVEMHRQEALKKDPTVDPKSIRSVTVSLRGSSFYMPVDECPDEAQFRGVVQEIREFEVEGQSFFSFQTTLVEPNDQPFQIRLFASKSVLGAFRPKVGEDMEGEIWLQGFPCKA